MVAVAGTMVILVLDSFFGGTDVMVFYGIIPVLDTITDRSLICDTRGWR